MSNRESVPPLSLPLSPSSGQKTNGFIVFFSPPPDDERQSRASGAQQQLDALKDQLQGLSLAEVK